MATRFRWRCAALVLALALAVPAVAAGLDEADRAYADGDHARALALYDAVLAEHPDDTHALFRSARLLSLSREFDAALERYDHLLRIEPDHPNAALERAKVLSWARRFDDSARAFEAILAERPELREARLGLARTTSWSGRQRAARALYLGLLERDPDAADAAVGLAQTYAWSGDARRARRAYLRALEIEPGKKEAELGLAYVALWTPDRVEAGRRADALIERFPDDPEVRDLHAAVQAADAWWSSVAWDRIDDTDDNRMDVTRIETGTGVGSRLDAIVGVARYELSNPVADATLDSIYGSMGWRVTRFDRLTLRVGRDRVEDSTGSTTDETIGGIAWRHAPDRAWRLDLAADRDPLRYSPAIADANVVLERVRARVTVEPAPDWRVAGTARHWDSSDGNARVGGTVEVARAWPVEPVTVETALVVEYADWDRDLDNGYFDPQDFLALLLRHRVRGPLPVRGGTWNVAATVGTQSFTISGVDVSDDTVLDLEGQMLVPLGGERVLLDVHAGWSDYAAQSASGFESTRFGARLRWIW
jgi:tetratricopeptide (TPR) repeat protein